MLNLAGLLLAVLVVAESFRSEPMWPRPERSASPRQRRWLGLGLILITSGGVVTWLNMTGEANLGLLSFAFPVLGLVVLVIGIARGPTDEELLRRERLLGQQGR